MQMDTHLLNPSPETPRAKEHVRSSKLGRTCLLKLRVKAALVLGSTPFMMSTQSLDFHLVTSCRKSHCSRLMQYSWQADRLCKR